jgi:hypothetical protein
MLWFRVQVSPINREGEPVEISWGQIGWNSTVLTSPAVNGFSPEVYSQRILGNKNPARRLCSSNSAPNDSSSTRSSFLALMA